MTMSDYSDLEKEIQEAPEPAILPKGTEVKVRIVKVTGGTTDDEQKDSFGAEWHSITFDVPEEVLCPMFNEFMWDLGSKDKIDPKQYQQALRQFRMFAEAFGLDYSRPFSWEDDLPGLEGWVILGIQKDKTGEYPDKNSVAKYVVGK